MPARRLYIFVECADAATFAVLNRRQLDDFIVLIESCRLSVEGDDAPVPSESNRFIVARIFCEPHQSPARLVPSVHYLNSFLIWFWQDQPGVAENDVARLCAGRAIFGTCFPRRAHPFSTVASPLGWQMRFRTSLLMVSTPHIISYC